MKNSSIGTLKAPKSFLDEMRSKHRCIYNVIDWSLDVFCKTANFPRSLVNIFQLISSPSPVCSYIPPTKEVKQLMERIMEQNIKSNSLVMRSLQMELPFFHSLLADLEIESCLPDVWKGLLLHLDSCAHRPFETANVVKTSSSALEESKYSWLV